MTRSQNWYKIVLIMRTSNLISYDKLLRETGASFFTASDLQRLFNLTNRNSLYKKIRALRSNKIIISLNKGKYYYPSKEINDFAIANFLYQPSYISLESALSMYSIISAFPYKITSLTIKKTKSFLITNKEYAYAKIAKNIFWGYEKKENYLIAIPEKASLDYLYLCYKGLRTFDREEFDLTKINFKLFKNYSQKFDITTQKYINKLKLC